MAEITEALFALEASAEEADHAGAVATISSLRRRTTVIIITELLASVVERRLAAVVRALAVDHDVVVASVADPSLQELCDSPATTRDELHQAAAAAHALERRREVAAALIDAGANVVDAPPGRVMREVADVYVELSRRKVVARRPRPSLR